MSSDLWAAFGGGGEDATANPWKQDTSSLSNSRDNATGSTRVQIQHSGDSPSRHLDSGHESDGGDSWSAVNQEIEDAWSKPPILNQSTQQPYEHQSSARTASIEDDDFGDFEAPHVDTTSTQPVSVSSIPPEQESGIGHAQIEDDFGDFENPEEDDAAQYQAPVSTASQSESNLKNRIIFPTQINDSLAHEHKPAIVSSSTTLIDYDPFAELEQLSGPTAPEESAQQQRAHPLNVKSAPGKKTSPKSAAPASRTIAMAEPDPDEEWDEMPDPSDTLKQSSAEPSSKKETTSTTPTVDKTIDEPQNALPPTNVPPPSILIPLASTIVQDLPGEIESILKSHEDYRGGKSALTQALGVLTALEDRVSVIKVAARILAGRKLRWKRDTILSQSMSIGASGRQGGMKLIGVDKTEVKREDREAAEFVRMWGKHQGRMRSALMKLPAQIDEKPPMLPHIAESLMVRTLKEAQGGIKAAKSCVVCGLKRDERVEKVDFDVWDQFGEWWTEHWGHTECRTFWTTHEQFLQQR